MKPSNFKSLFWLRNILLSLILITPSYCASAEDTSNADLTKSNFNFRVDFSVAIDYTGQPNSDSTAFVKVVDNNAKRVVGVYKTQGNSIRLPLLTYAIANLNPKTVDPQALNYTLYIYGTKNSRYGLEIPVNIVGGGTGLYAKYQRNPGMHEYGELTLKGKWDYNITYPTNIPSFSMEIKDTPNFYFSQTGHGCYWNEDHLQHVHVQDYEEQDYGHNGQFEYRGMQLGCGVVPTDNTITLHIHVPYSVPNYLSEKSIVLRHDAKEYEWAGEF